MTEIRSFRDLVVWQKGMDLAESVYRASKAFPKEEQYGQTSQLRRAAISIPSNIAEGQARITTGEFVQFLGIARGSLAEVETQFLLAQRFGYLTPESTQIYLDLITETGRLLNGLLRSLTTNH